MVNEQIRFLAKVRKGKIKIPPRFGVREGEVVRASLEREKDEDGENEIPESG